MSTLPVTLEEAVRDACIRARGAARRVAPRSTEDKNRALVAIAIALETHQATILAANRADVEAARDRGTKGALLDRLTLDEVRLRRMAESVREVARLPDPVGEVVARTTRPNGLVIQRVRVPLGVVAMIYEARPNVTAEASALTLKSGNAVVLRGGSEADRSNRAIAEIIGGALEASGLPREAVQVLPFTDREAVRALVRQDGLVDLAIPRGGESLIRFVTENARVPVVQHYKGVCHLFLDSGADLERAIAITLDAKLSRPGVCNALECLLVDASDAERLLPPVGAALLARGCELRGCERTRAFLPQAKPAAPDDWGREFLAEILAIRVVDGLAGALAHVAEYGSGHTEAILTPHPAHANTWRHEVDAACVVVNASTRFHDGGELGLGAEIGIATSRLHWRGPMGLESLTTMKWVVEGDGQVRG
jgi:glutamate-5-semialdehyde dehydrogenase